MQEGDTASDQGAAAPDPQAAGLVHAPKSRLPQGLASLRSLVLYICAVIGAVVACRHAYGAVSFASLELVCGLLVILSGAVLGVFVLRLVLQALVTWFAGLSADVVKVYTAAVMYFNIFTWAARRQPIVFDLLVWGIVVTFCTVHMLLYGTPYLYRFLHARYRDTNLPPPAAQRSGTRDSSVVIQFVSIMRLGAVLVGRWSPADMHGLLACCAAAAWLYAVFGALDVLTVVVLGSVQALFILKLIEWPLGKLRWARVAAVVQDSGVVSVKAGMSLMVYGCYVVEWWSMLHYFATICLVVWVCTRIHSCAAALSRLLTIAADGVEQHIGECLLHVSTFATTRVALPTGVKPG
jgi:hypothetical protein